MMSEIFFNVYVNINEIISKNIKHIKDSNELIWDKY